MLIFSAKDLKPVLTEARNNHCDIYLVKDRGVYLMSATGEMTPRGRRVAYARGCNPLKDENWWETARDEVGEDNFGMVIKLTEDMMHRIISKGKPLRITASENAFLAEC